MPPAEHEAVGGGATTLRNCGNEGPETRSALAQVSCDGIAEKLNTERERLRTQILETRRRRALAHQQMNAVTSRAQLLLGRHNEVERERREACSRYRSARSSRMSAECQMGILRKIDVTNDTFHIWHRGPFGTINGLRLGAEVKGLPALEDEGISAAREGDGAGGTATNKTPAGSTFDFSSIASSFFADSGASNANSTYDSLKVPWPETNAALGQVALLLLTLKQKPNSGIIFLTHELIPMGSSSKVGVLHGEGRASVEYNLFYAEDSFQFFGRRNFNTALDGLFRCLKDAADVAASRDQTISLPYDVLIPVGRGDITIGGLPISYDVATGDVWTRAMKYLLTNLKWLQAFAAKNVDR